MNRRLQSKGVLKFDTTSSTCETSLTVQSSNILIHRSLRIGQDEHASLGLFLVVVALNHDFPIFGETYHVVLEVNTNHEHGERNPHHLFLVRIISQPLAVEKCLSLLHATLATEIVVELLVRTD